MKLAWIMELDARRFSVLGALLASACSVTVGGGDGALSGSGGLAAGSAGQSAAGSAGDAAVAGSAGEGGAAGSMSTAGSAGEGGASGSAGMAGMAGMSLDAGGASFPAPTCDAEAADEMDACVQCLKQNCCDAWLGCDDAACLQEVLDVSACMLDSEFPDSDQLDLCVAQSRSSDMDFLQMNSQSVIDCTNETTDDANAAGFTRCGIDCFGDDIFFD